MGMLLQIAFGVGLLMMARVAAAAERAVPGSSCSGEAFLRSGLMEDLDPPACARDAAGRAALEEARQALLRAQHHVLADAAEQALVSLEHAREALGPMAGRPEAAGYFRALVVLGARAQLVPEVDTLRACHAQAQVLLRQGETPELPVARAQAERAEECLAALRRILAQRSVQEATPEVLWVEVAPGQPRRLQELLTEVRAAHRAALLRRQAAQQAWEVVRSRWLRVLFGDRLRVFNEHPDQLPEYEGRARGPLPASIVPRWRYRTPEGLIETFLFRRNRLISRTVEDPRRS
ncbi:MAG: hypothetical protein RMK29_12805 [Myxococcales bacterium]|nr:hypothetical protein [Myxococcota bacterium]MDW8282585.1 hypothetical protein [Myxococcales bacterium]